MELSADALDSDRVITVDNMDNGGSFAGVYTSGVLVRVYTRANGNYFDIGVALGAAMVVPSM